MASSAAVASAAAPALTAANPQWLWFLSRGSGLVLLVLFTAVIVLGVATRTGRAARRWPLFATAELHRTLSLFTVWLLAMHVVTAIADPYVRIGWAATAVPFLSPYRTVAIGLGTLAVDLGAAVLLTSVLRHRLGLRAWRAVHWLGYLAWPAAFVHALGAGGDMHIPWAAVLTWGSAAAVAVAVAVRLASRPWSRAPSASASATLSGPRTRRSPSARPGTRPSREAQRSRGAQQSQRSWRAQRSRQAHQSQGAQR